MDEIQRERVGQLEITWYQQSSAADRESFHAKLGKIKSARAYRVSYATRVSQWEAQGLAAIMAPQPEQQHAPHMVRIYYYSEGGEILAFEATLGRAAADRLCYAHHAQQIGYRVGPSKYDGPDPDRIITGPGPGSDARDAEIWQLGAKVPPLRHGARLVVLPSQMNQIKELTKLVDELAQAA